MTIRALLRMFALVSVFFVLAPPLQARPRVISAAREAQRVRPAQAVSFSGSGGWGARSRYQGLYDPSKLAVARGRVLAVQPMRPLPGMAKGVQLLVRTPTGVLPVHLGPTWFVVRQDVRLVRGAQIDVAGVRARLRGRRVMIASEVATADRVIKLRDALGLPLWSWARHLPAPRAEQ